MLKVDHHTTVIGICIKVNLSSLEKLMDNKVSVGNRTEHGGTPLFISLGLEQLSSTTDETERSEGKLKMNKRRIKFI